MHEVEPILSTTPSNAESRLANTFNRVDLLLKGLCHATTSSLVPADLKVFQFRVQLHKAQLFKF